jgi:hypothetical protein
MRVSPRLAGFTAVTVPSLAVLAVLTATGSHPDAGAGHRRAVGSPAPAVATRGSGTSASATAGQVGRIAAGQLSELRQQVRRCGAGAREEGPACTLWPYAHVAIASRVDGVMLAATAGRLPTGRCRARAMGAAGALRLLAASADDLVRSRYDDSAGSRARAAEHHATVMALARYAQGVLAARRWRRCVPGGALRRAPGTRRVSSRTARG